MEAFTTSDASNNLTFGYVTDGVLHLSWILLQIQSKVWLQGGRKKRDVALCPMWNKKVSCST